jgi:hypothetical protein
MLKTLPILNQAGSMNFVALGETLKFGIFFKKEKVKYIYIYILLLKT